MLIISCSISNYNNFNKWILKIITYSVTQIFHSLQCNNHNVKLHLYQRIRKKNDEQTTNFQNLKYSSERKKRNFKKSKTTTNDFTFNGTEEIKELISVKKSEFTKQFNDYKQNYQIEIVLKYFGLKYQQILLVNDQIIAAELIVLALKKFEQYQFSDKSKYEYPNFNLAYKLIGSEVSPIKSVFTNDENFDNDQLECPEMDLKSKVFYQGVEIIPGLNSFGLDFQFIKQTYLSNPEYLILLKMNQIENQIEKFQNMITHQNIYNGRAIICNDTCIKGKNQINTLLKQGKVISTKLNLR